MLITPISYNTHYLQYQTNFKAIPIAKYGYLKTTPKDVIICQLEKRDIGYMENILKNLKQFFKKYDIDNESAKQVIEEAFGAGIEILKKSEQEQKARILMAFYNNEPCSILIGNVLKVDKSGRYHYSSRKNHAKQETELDWLATWNKKIPGEGQATVYEYFHTLLKDGFKQCFVRSEIPEKSTAVDFYTRMGFEPLTKKPRPILRKNDNTYVIGTYDDVADKIIPMKATVKDIIETFNKKADTTLRKEIKNKKSFNLPKENFDNIQI